MLRVRAILAPRLHVLDEIGYLPLNKEQADLFFQVVTKRYERGSVILQSLVRRLGEYVRRNRRPHQRHARPVAAPCRRHPDSGRQLRGALRAEGIDKVFSRREERRARSDKRRPERRGAYGSPGSGMR